MTILIPFPPRPATKEDPLAYWTPQKSLEPRTDEIANRHLAALDQMYGYYFT